MRVNGVLILFNPNTQSIPKKLLNVTIERKVNDAEFFLLMGPNILFSVLADVSTMMRKGYSK